MLRSLAFAFTTLVTFAGVAEAKTAIYLNRNTTRVSIGENSAKNNAWAFTDAPVEVEGWQADETAWADTLACVEILIADFDAEVVEAEPTEGSYIEVIISGNAPTDFDLPFTVNGIGVATPECKPHPFALGVVFPRAVDDDVADTCTGIAFIIGVSMGLEASIGESEVMSFVPYPTKTFTDVDLPCGTSSAVDTCRCGEPTQNSYRHLLQTFGPKGGVSNLQITAPEDGATVPPNFTVQALLPADAGQARVLIDGTEVGMLSGGSLALSDLAAGPHSLTVATDTEEVTHNISVGVAYDDLESGEGAVMGGCRTGGQAPLSTVFTIAALLLVGRRRRTAR
jgi:hypothetical protein